MNGGSVRPLVTCLTMTPSISSLLSVELRLLRYVVAVAEELHFTRASMRLHIATPSLSKQIRQLEQALGYALFDRKTRVVALTPAGSAFVTEARRALMYARRAVEAGAAAYAGEERVIRIGCTPLLDAALLPKIRECFVQTMGDTTLLFQSTYSTAQIDQILTGRLDAGLIVLPAAPSDLRIDSIFREHLVAAVPEDWDLAQCPVLGPKEIAAQPIIWFGRLINSFVHQHFVDSCRQVGFTPNIIHEVSTVMEMLESVAAGIGISFVKKSIQARLRPEGIAFCEVVAPGLSLEVGIACRNEGSSGGLLALLHILNQLATGNRDAGRSAIETVSR